MLSITAAAASPLCMMPGLTVSNLYHKNFHWFLNTLAKQGQKDGVASKMARRASQIGCILHQKLAKYCFEHVKPGFTITSRAD